MEDQSNPNYTQEDVQKLQDKVRKLEFQLSQQKSLHSKNGFVTEIKKSVTYVDDSDLICEDIIDVTSDNSSIRSWLLAPPNVTENNDLSSEELLAWVRHNSDANPNQSFQLLRRKLYTDLYNAELEKRKNIDTRTFTRPKKRIARMPLEMMPENVPSSSNLQLSPEASQEPVFAPKLPNFALNSPVFTHQLPTSSSKVRSFSPQLTNPGPQTTVFSSQLPNSGPQTTVFSPQLPNSGPQTTVFSPQLPNSGPPSTVFSPQLSSYGPETTVFSPQPPKSDPQSTVFSPQLSSYGPETTVFSPQPPNSGPQSTVLSPQPSCAPQAPVFTPRIPNFPVKSVAGALPDRIDDSQILANMTCSLLESSLMGSLIVTDQDAELAPTDAVLASTAAAIAAAAEVLSASPASKLPKAPSVPELREEDEQNSSASETVTRALSSSIQRTYSGSLAALNHSDMTVVNINTTFNKGSDPGLNMANSSAPTSRGSSPANSTFICSGRRGTITLGSRRGSSQMGSADSDDQLSVASDCSASSASRIMSVGEVHNLARLQEESLLMVSTPKSIVSPKKRMLASDEKLSPINALQGREGVSSKSEFSASNDYLNRSPVSSKHSSRSASPSGIRPPSESRLGNGFSNLIRRDTFTASRENMNSTFNKEAGASNGLNRETYSSNINTATIVRVPRAAQAPGEPQRGLRLPSARPRASGLPVLSQRPSTGIPRPPSRIPPPRTRCPRPSTASARCASSSAPRVPEDSPAPPDARLPISAAPTETPAVAAGSSNAPTARCDARASADSSHHTKSRNARVSSAPTGTPNANASTNCSGDGALFTATDSSQHTESPHAGISSAPADCDAPNAPTAGFAPKDSCADRAPCDPADSGVPSAPTATTRAPRGGTRPPLPPPRSQRSNSASSDSSASSRQNRPAVRLAASAAVRAPIRRPESDRFVRPNSAVSSSAVPIRGPSRLQRPISAISAPRAAATSAVPIRGPGQFQRPVSATLGPKAATAQIRGPSRFQRPIGPISRRHGK